MLYACAKANLWLWLLLCIEPNRDKPKPPDEGRLLIHTHALYDS
jgi:hypothetical protein